MFDFAEGSKKSENFVGRFQSDSTISLFAYLKDIRGKHVLFGHQLVCSLLLTISLLFIIFPPYKISSFIIL